MKLIKVRKQDSNSRQDFLNKLNKAERTFGREDCVKVSFQLDWPDKVVPLIIGLQNISFTIPGRDIAGAKKMANIMENTKVGILSAISYAEKTAKQLNQELKEIGGME